MKTQTDESFFLLSTISGIAVVLLGVAGVARIMGWLPNPNANSANWWPGQRVIFTDGTNPARQ